MTMRESFLTVICKKTGKIFTFNSSTGKFIICLVLML